MERHRRFALHNAKLAEIAGGVDVHHRFETCGPHHQHATASISSQP